MPFTVVRGSQSEPRTGARYTRGCSALLKTNAPLMSRRSTVISALCAWMFDLAEELQSAIGR